LGVSIFLLKWAIDLKFCVRSWHNGSFKSEENILHRNLAFIDYGVVTEVHSP
jgi:hypothetical protein